MKTSILSTLAAMFGLSRKPETAHYEITASPLDNDMRVTQPAPKQTALRQSGYRVINQHGAFGKPKLSRSRTLSAAHNRAYGGFQPGYNTGRWHRLKQKGGAS
jgi:hypothetical protein